MLETEIGEGFMEPSSDPGSTIGLPNQLLSGTRNGVAAVCSPRIGECCGAVLQRIFITELAAAGEHDEIALVYASVVISPFNVVNFPKVVGTGGFICSTRRVCASWVVTFTGWKISGAQATPSRMKSCSLRFLERMERFGLGAESSSTSAAARLAPAKRPGNTSAGAGRAEAIFEGADLLLNFHYAIAPDLLVRFRRTALVDIDPGLLQFWISHGQLAVPRHAFISRRVKRSAQQRPDFLIAG